MKREFLDLTSGTGIAPRNSSWNCGNINWLLTHETKCSKSRYFPIAQKVTVFKTNIYPDLPNYYLPLNIVYVLFWVIQSWEGRKAKRRSLISQYICSDDNTAWMGCRRHRNNSIPFDCKGSTTRLNWQLKYSFVQGVKKQKSLEILWINPNWLHNKRCIMGVFRRFLHLTTLVPNSFLIFLVSVVVSIDIADRFIALLSPENNQNTQWSHRPIRGGYCSIWPMRGQTWPSGYNDDPRADSKTLLPQESESRCQRYWPTLNNSSPTQLYLIQNSAMTKIFPEQW